MTLRLLFFSCFGGFAKNKSMDGFTITFLWLFCGVLAKDKGMDDLTITFLLLVWGISLLCILLDSPFLPPGLTVPNG